jgi:ferredoxin
VAKPASLYQERADGTSSEAATAPAMAPSNTQIRSVLSRLTTVRSYLNPASEGPLAAEMMVLHHYDSRRGWQSHFPERSSFMSMVIHEDCINCGNCEPSCPNQAIAAGDSIYRIDSERCTECVGAYDQPQCIDVCPIEGCIAVDPAHTEPEEVLRARYQQLHPN